MSYVLKVNACVISKKGNVNANNTDEFYLNGKFTSEGSLENMQAALENRGVEYVFAVSDKLSVYEHKESSPYSMVKSMRKYHEKIAINSGDIEFRIDELKSRVEEVTRLADSMSEMPVVGKIQDDLQENEEHSGYAGIVLSSGKIIAITVGTAKAYLMREGVFKPLTMDYAKTKRLLDLGIITDEEAEAYSEKLGSREQSNESVQLSDILEIREGDKFLICTDGLTDYVEDDRIEDILSMRSDSTYIANMLVAEAKKRGSQDDLTAMVIRVDQVSGATPVKKNTVTSNAMSAQASGRERNREVNIPTYRYSKKDLKKYEGILRIVLVVFTSIILILIVLLLIRNMQKTASNAGRDNNRPGVTDATTQNPGQNNTTTDVDVDENEDDDGEDDEYGGEIIDGNNPGNVNQNNNTTRTYQVVAGDTLIKISRDNYGTETYYKKIAKYNNMPRLNALNVGDKLVLPPVSELDAVQITDQDFVTEPVTTSTTTPTSTTTTSTETTAGGNSASNGSNNSQNGSSNPSSDTGSGNTNTSNTPSDGTSNGGSGNIVVEGPDERTSEDTN